MKKISNQRFQENYVEETLDNGLKVILWQKKDFKKSFFLMATPLGSLDLNQESKDKEYAFPAGIAHFLEHKMFEDEDKDVMDLFSEMGANVNAFTSYSETAYYFSTSEDPFKPLNLLLDFVQSLNISDESVEKEKGIIIQELEMYQQMSDIRMINETLACLFKEHPLIYDIGGDNESVSSTTKQQLEACYKLNYHPSKMILVGVVDKDPKIILDVIKANQDKKHFSNVEFVKRKVYHEQYEVNKNKYEFNMDISVPKVNVAFKLSGVKDSYEQNRKEWCFKMLFDLYFSSLNPKYQDWLDDEIINNSFSFEIDLGKDYGLLMFYSETNKTEIFKETMIKTLKEIDEVDDLLLQNLRNRYFGTSINALNDHKQIAVNFMRNYFAELDFFESLEVVETIKKEDLLNVLKEIDFDNYCEVKILPNN